MKRPDRWFPHPWLTVTLVVGWLLLMNSLSFGNLLMGLVLGVIIPWLTHVFWPASRYRLRVGKLVLFVARVVTDIVLANLQVARLILGPRRDLRPAFVNYPLTLESDFSISVLASTISLTPGTVGADVSDDNKLILIHSLDAEDEQEIIDTIRARYEKPLLEMFR